MPRISGHEILSRGYAINMKPELYNHEKNMLLKTLKHPPVESFSCTFSSNHSPKSAFNSPAFRILSSKMNMN